MSIREAMMEMYGAKKVKREAWVPEAITDEDAANFMGAAAAAKKAGKSHFDFGGKKYKVTMKSDAAKKIGESAGCPECGADGECQCEQPVQEAKVDELSKKTYQSYFKKADRSQRDAERKLKDVRSKRDIFAKPGGQERKLINTIKKRNRGMDDARDRIANKESVEEAKVDEVSYKTAMKSYQKAMGQSKDADTAGDKETGDKKFDQAVKFGRYANKKFQSSRNKKKLVRTLSRQVPLGTLTKEESVQEEMDPKDHVKYNDEMEMYCVYNKSGKVVAKFKDEEDANNYAMKNHDDLMEAKAPGATAQHGPDDATSDSFKKQVGRTPLEKEFVNMHKTEVGLDVEKVTAQNKQSIEDALKQTPGRLGDQRKGDTSFVNPIKADIIDGITKALQQMKTNN